MWKILIGLVSLCVLSFFIGAILCFTPWQHIAVGLMLVGLFLEVAYALAVLVWLLID